MRSRRSDRVQPQLDRLWRVGTLGTLSDAQLLDRFATRRDAAAEAAFEELVIRHGPMVLRVTRSVLRNPHDAEDTFQAVFLILANRAGSIRRKTSLASWLFGVAQRVATRARRSEARRRLREQRVAARSPEGTQADQADPDWEILHDEVNGLPARLREPILLCYLQGLTYTAAAQRLGVSEMAVRGRLARARERLCRQLARRGVTASAGLLAAGAARQVQAAVPPALVQSTIRIALGFVAGNTAAVLAQGVLTSMLLTHLRVATIVAGVGLAGSYSAWQAVAAGDGDDGAHDGPEIPTVQVIRPAARTIVREVGQPSFVESSQSTPIHSRASGYVEKVLVDIGDRVKAGDVLATMLVPEPAGNEVTRNGEVRHAEERVKLEHAETELAAARARVAEAKAIVLKYQAEVDRWATEVKRLEREVKRGVVDEQVLRESTYQWKAKVAARDAAQATVATTEAELRVKEAAVAVAKAKVGRLVPEPAEKGKARDQYVRRAEQPVELARKELELAEAEAAAARAAAEEAKAIVNKYQADVDRWDSEVKRLDREVKRGVIDPQILRESTNQWKAKVAARDAALATIAKAEAELRAKEAAVAKAKVSLSIAEADLADARSARGPLRSSTGRRSAPAGAPEAQARLARAQAAKAEDERDADRWEVELQRLRQALAPQGPPATAHDGAGERDKALAAIERAEAALRSYRATVSKAEVAVAVANAALAVASSGRQPDQPTSGRVTLTAPYNGLVVARSANTGDAVRPAANNVAPAPLFVIDRVDKARVVVEIPEQDAPYVRVGTRASVSIKGYRDEPVDARVARISWARNAKSRVLRAEIELANPDGRLLPGMYAFAKVFIERRAVRVLPLAAVMSCDDRSYCWVLKDGRAVRTEIKTGTSDGKWVEVEGRATASGGDRRWAPFDGSEPVILGDGSTLRDYGPVRLDRGAAEPQ